MNRGVGESVDGAEEPRAPFASRDAAHRARRLAMHSVAAVLLALPVLRMIDIVLGGTALQHADYWIMLPDITTKSGGLDVGGLFVFQNEHPVVVAKLIYWLNIRLFAGSNIALGLIDIALVVGQLVIIALMLRRSAFDRLQALIVLVVASVLLFNLVGTWNFVKAMSGTAWLSANLFALAAVYLRGRDHRVWAGAAAVLTSISYGTGIAIWPALIVMGASRRPWRDAWREWPYAIGALATFAWYQTGPAANDRSLSLYIVKVTAAIFGFVFGFDHELVRLIGYAGLVGIPLVIGAMVARSRMEGTSLWVGVATYGFVATTVIGFGRAEFTRAFGLQDRYYSLPALAWLGLFGLVALAVQQLWAPPGGEGPGSSRHRLTATALVAAMAVVVISGTAVAGRGHADALTAPDELQDMREIALRLGLADNSSYLVGGWAKIGDLTPRLVKMGHYPFTDAWNRDCGLIDTQLAARDDEPTIGGGIRTIRKMLLLPGGLEIKGDFRYDGEVRCVVVTDGERHVLGVAIPGPADPDDRDSGHHRFHGIARRATAYRAFVVAAGNDTPVPIGRDDTPATTDR